METKDIFDILLLGGTRFQCTTQDHGKGQEQTLASFRVTATNITDARHQACAVLEHQYPNPFVCQDMVDNLRIESLDREQIQAVMQGREPKDSFGTYGN